MLNIKNKANGLYIEPFISRLDSQMAFSWKVAIDVQPRSLTHAEWKGWPFPFTLALTLTYRGCSPKAPWMTWMNRADWDRMKQPFNDNCWSVQSLSDSEKGTGQAESFMIVWATNHSHFIPPSCSPLCHKCCFLSVNLGERKRSERPPTPPHPCKLTPSQASSALGPLSAR